MESFNSGRASRRFAIGGGLAAAGFVVTRQTRGRVLTQRGIAAGGWLQVPAGEAIFSLFASRLVVVEGEQEIVSGSVRWVELPSGLALASTGITAYENIPDERGEARRIEGTMSVNGEGSYPFTLEVVDVGPPGAGQDLISLVVGGEPEAQGAATPSAGFLFSYQAEGVVAAGDVQDVDIDFDLDAGTAAVATPTA